MMADDDEAIRLIKALAALGADPFWVYEAIAVEQEAAKERLGAAQTDTETGWFAKSNNHPPSQSGQ
jgi:hypothetical protein